PLPGGQYAILTNNPGAPEVASAPIIINAPTLNLTPPGPPGSGITTVVELTYPYARLQHDPGFPGVDNVVVDRFRAAATPPLEFGDPVSWTGRFGRLGPGATAGSPIVVSLQRHIDATGFAACVPYFFEVGAAGATPGGPPLPNSWPATFPIPEPVYPITADTGTMARAMPTTGCMLLLMRYAHEYDPTRGFKPFNDRLRLDPDLLPAVFADANTQRQSIDNGHMPVFGRWVPQPPPDDPIYVGEFAHPVPVPLPDPPTLATLPGLALDIPWGQLVFDYFTALPLSNTYDSTNVSGVCSDFNVGETECNFPTVDQSGLRVHGRVNINAAPWKVLAGVPRLTANDLPLYSAIGAFPQIADTDGNPDTVEVLGNSLAKTIVAYRERREIDGGGGNTTGDFSDSNDYPERGFRTVGEMVLASNSPNPNYSFDNNNPISADPDYLQAAAQLVALSDWVTTRGHVFTIYGQIRGVGNRNAVDARAIRFQETVDRLPSMFDNSPPQRIGQRTVGSYSDARSD
ncbi:MAG: hypothetical protein ACYSUI_19300, partial [Planctomycetota bacterium]